MKSLNVRTQRQRGAYLIFMALLAPVMILFGAYIMEFSAYYLIKSRLQNSVDLAALSTMKQYSVDYITTDKKVHKKYLDDVAQDVLTFHNSKFRLKTLVTGKTRRMLLKGSPNLSDEDYDPVELTIPNPNNIDAIYVTATAEISSFLKIFYDMVDGMSRIIAPNHVNQSSRREREIEASALAVQCPTGAIMLGLFCHCGDEILQTELGETCDIGDQNGVDSCSALPPPDYQRTCPNTIVCEWCNGQCSEVKQSIVGPCCGDNKLHSPVEQCDGTPGCTRDCCYEGYIWNGTECVRGETTCPNQILFTDPGVHTWTVPANTESVQVKVWGAGGAGGSGRKMNDSHTGGSGGGGGGYGEKSLAFTTGETFKIVIGRGGISNAEVQQEGGGTSEVRRGSGDLVVGAGGGGGGGFMYADVGRDGNSWIWARWLLTEQFLGKDAEGFGQIIGNYGAGKGAYKPPVKRIPDLPQEVQGAKGGYGYGSSESSSSPSFTGESAIGFQWNEQTENAFSSKGGNGANGGLGGAPGRCGRGDTGFHCTGPDSWAKDGQSPGGGGGGSDTGLGGNGANGQVMLCPVYRRPVVNDVYGTPIKIQAPPDTIQYRVLYPQSASYESKIQCDLFSWTIEGRNSPFCSLVSCKPGEDYTCHKNARCEENGTMVKPIYPDFPGTDPVFGGPATGGFETVPTYAVFTDVQTCNSFTSSWEQDTCPGADRVHEFVCPQGVALSCQDIYAFAGDSLSEWMKAVTCNA